MFLEQIINGLNILIIFIPVLGLLVFIHELGHFLAAKWAGIRVERFSLGFPPRLFGKKIGDTDYCISWIPLGGYVKMAGMIDESMDSEVTGQPWEFMSKPIWKRMIVIAAGPVMNVLLALFFFTAVYSFYGMRETTTVIEQVMPNSPAAAVGLQPDDKILMIDGKNISSWDEITAVIHPNAEKTLSIEWERNAQRMQSFVTPRRDSASTRGLIGIAPKLVTRQMGFMEALQRSGRETWGMTQATFQFIGRIFTGKESAREGLAGPIFMAKTVSQAAQQGFDTLLYLTAFISLQLAILNILPIPALDGGHLLFLAIEGILRRPLSLRLRMVIQQIGMALLLVLMAFVLFNDVQKLITQ